MDRVHLPHGGVSLSRLVLGGMRLATGGDDGSAAAELIEHAVSLGITTFDHADIYGGYAVEEAFGRALAAWGGDRESIELVTKCDIMLPVEARPQNRVKHYDTSPTHIRTSVERSLRNFDTEYVDLLLLHRPDPLLAADDTAAALAELVKAGKVRAVGVSNFLPHQVDLLQSRLDIPLAANQVELSVLATGALTDGSLDHAQQHRYAPMIWSPLGGGGLFTSNDARSARVRAVVERIAAESEVSPGVVALSWVLRHPSKPVAVLGTTNPDRLTDLARSCELHLGRQDWFEILEASEGHPVA